MKGIIFSTWMVQAIQAGKKSQTRRLHKPDCQVGDIVYVKENFARLRKGNRELVVFKADGQMKEDYSAWESSYFMRERDARYFLKITGIRTERLNSITEEDAKKEGMPKGIIQLAEGAYGNQIMPLDVNSAGSYRASFQYYWTLLHQGKLGAQWHHNPMVWVIDFKRVERMTAHH